MSSYRGTYTLLTFIYTRCPLPDYCPRMNAHFAAVQRGLKADPRLGGRVRLLSMSFDPEFDTPAQAGREGEGDGSRPRPLALRDGAARRWSTDSARNSG